MASSMTAYDFTKPIQGDNHYCFGVDLEETVRALRQLAEDIEAKRIAPQSVRVVTLADSNDFTTTVLRFVYSAKKIKKLWSGGKGFPVAAVRPE